ncbi:unnamed protein product [Parascedosporium putredinis]|uniref:Actin-related protein 4 n=1 Tax=Parascedosporium putredinis TaxID=1442378 RepID=A0A9P1H859_9PEZI|nr:unnamed protein product [Parascedosporium putredinis]CAI8002088.1 unnamed protein product [Parascedosporium putredinis]
MAQQPLPTSQAPTDTYGGDEVSAIVLDPGYCFTRAGFAGEDSPSIEVRNYMNKDSVVEDWDAATQIWENMLLNRLHAPKATPPAKNGLNDNGDDADPAAVDVKKDGEGDVSMGDNAEAAEVKAREKAVEIIMENWGCPAFWFSRTPVLTAFAAGKASALVVDIGGANTSVTCIHDGVVLKRSIQRSPVGGLWLSAQLRAVFESSDSKVDLVPTFLVENKTPVDAGAPAQYKQRKFDFDLHSSFRAWEEERLLTEFKESVVETWRGPGKYTAPGNEDFLRQQPGRVFEMPDGSNQMWREQRFRALEGMWDETAAYTNTPEEYRLTKAQTIPELIRASINAVDVDLRPNLLQNVVVTGSTSLINGFGDRLHNELSTMYPGTKIKLHAAGLSSERRFGAWIGGSILASLGTFHQMWISKQEYEENGVNVVEKRCK